MTPHTGSTVNVKPSNKTNALQKILAANMKLTPGEAAQRLISRALAKAERRRLKNPDATVAELFDGLPDWSAVFEAVTHSAGIRKNALEKSIQNKAAKTPAKKAETKAKQKRTMDRMRDIAEKNLDDNIERHVARIMNMTREEALTLYDVPRHMIEALEPFQRMGDKYTAEEIMTAVRKSRK